MIQPPFDVHRVLADLRADAPGAIEQAYRITFGGELGRLVLAHILAQGGVGRRFGGDLTNQDLAYHQGGHDLACEIRDLAGFDQASTVLMTITGHLEGRDDERTSWRDGDGNADPEPQLD